MDAHEKTRFVDQLVHTVKVDILSKIKKMPEDWDGHEIRQFIADRFAEASFTLKEDKKRYRRYRNEIATRAW